MKMINTLRLVLTVSLALQSALASEWAHWRGPNYNGSTDEKNLPTTWSKSENIAWRAALPGPSGASPHSLLAKSNTPRVNRRVDARAAARGGEKT